MNSKLAKILWSLLGAALIVGFQNCSGQSFMSIDSQSKAQKLAEDTIFGPNNVSDANDTASTDGAEDRNDTRKEDDEDEDESEDSNDVACEKSNAPVVVGNEIPVRWVCSDSDSKKTGNIAASAALRIELLSSSGAVACSFVDNNARSEILTSKKFTMSSVSANCPQLVVGQTYRIRISDAARPAGQSLIYKASMSITKRATDYQFSMAKMPVLADYNDEPQMGLAEGQCEETHSPLVIRFEHAMVKGCGFEHLLLSEPAKGILFDILGARSTPAPYTKKMVSWATTKTFHFITLPNENGVIEGIDQLFGDNTKGPDGQFAKDGYAALAKFDGMSVDGKTRVMSADGQIDSRDPIFGLLRLWNDANQDGVSQAGELKSLAEMQVDIIDLKFDPTYYEMDVHGNEIKYKSVAQTKDGKLHTVFDLWFVLGNQ